MREFRSASTNIVIVFTMGWVGGRGGRGWNDSFARCTVRCFLSLRIFLQERTLFCEPRFLMPPSFMLIIIGGDMSFTCSQGKNGYSLESG